MTENTRLEQLERLQRLKESGALTDEEFSREKARVLDGAGAASPLPEAQDTEQAEEQARPRRAGAGFVVGALAVAAAVGIGVWAAMPVREAVDAAGLKDTASDAASPVAAASSEAPVELSPEEALAAAFKAATGRDSAYTLKSRDGDRTVTPLRLLDLPFGPVLLASSELADGCHGCAGAIGVYYLKREGDGFIVAKQWPDAVKGWGWGAPPQEWSVTEKFTRFPAIYAEGGYTGQGVTCGSATLTELTPNGPVESDVIGLSYSNGGAVLEETGETGFGEPARDVKGTITNVVKGKSFDVVVKGAESLRETYRYSGGKFVRQGGESRLAC